MAYLNYLIIKKMAGKLPVSVDIKEYKDSKNYRYCEVRSQKMGKGAIRFWIKQWKDDSVCLLGIFGDEKRKARILKIIQEEMSFEHGLAEPQFSKLAHFPVENKEYDLEIYAWSVNPMAALDKVLDEIGHLTKN